MYLDIQDNEKVWQHFNHPHHFGIFSADKNVAQAQVGTPTVSNVIHWQMLLTNDAKCNKIIIEDIRYQVVGCGYQIAACSYLSDCLVGRSLDEISASISKLLIEKLSLPEHKWHCAYLLEDVVSAALADHKSNAVASENESVIAVLATEGGNNSKDKKASKKRQQRVPAVDGSAGEESVMSSNETVLLSATDSALNYIRSQAHDKGLAVAYLHFGVKKTGCSGFSYVLEFGVDDNKNGYPVQLADDVCVVIDAESLPFLSGTQLDYRMESFGGVMKFNNPNEKGSCGCGESFTVADIESSSMNKD